MMNFRSDNEAGAHPLIIAARWAAPSPRAAQPPLARTSGHDGSNELGPGHTVVTILADSGTRYQSNLFNPVFLKERSLPTPPWLE
jgi:hypothetical protein